MRLTAAKRRTQVIDTALSMAESGHYLKLTREALAAKVGLSGPLIQYHFGTMAKLRRAIMRAAVQRKCLKVIGQGLTANDSQALKADPELRAAALNSLLTKL